MAIETYKYRCQYAWCKFLSIHIESREGNSVIVHFPLMEKNDSKLLLLFFSKLSPSIHLHYVDKNPSFYLNKNIKIFKSSRSFLFSFLSARVLAPVFAT